MDRRTKENLLYVVEDLRARFGKTVLLLYFCLFVAAGFVWGFQKIDAYLTPSFAEFSAPPNRFEVYQETRQEARISIPKLQVEAPVRFVESTNPADFLEPLKNGVAHYPSVLPGQKGTSIILGHSAPPAWFGNPYDDIFSNLKDLEQGDHIVVTRNGKLYRYQVNKKVFLSRGQDIPKEFLETSRSKLLLLSCWPPGINNKRIMIESEII